MSEFRSCVKVEVVVLGSPSLISLMVSVDIKHHEKKTGTSICKSIERLTYMHLYTGGRVLKAYAHASLYC